jgi:TetR/AcrR family transcriptional repressor of nem operon
MTRAEQKQQAHRRIIAAAARQLREGGLDKTGVQRVMEEAGLTHGGFYSHFDSKEQLVVEAMQSALEEGRERIAAGRGEPGPDRRMRIFKNYLSRAHCDAPGAGCPLPSTSADIVRAPDSIRRAYDDELAKIIATLEAQHSDLPAEDVHVQALGTLALAVGSLLLARAALDQGLSDDILDSCRQFAANNEGASKHDD